MRTEWEGKLCVLSIQRIITEERNSKTYPILESDISDREAVRWWRSNTRRPWTESML